MAEGNKTWKGLAVPLNGESQITQITAATDIISLTGASSQTGDFLVCQNSSGTEKFVIKAAGYINQEALTTAPTTGLTKGDMFVVWSGNSTPVLAICSSTAANTLKYISPFDTKTLGRAS